MTLELWNCANQCEDGLGGKLKVAIEFSIGPFMMCLVNARMVGDFSWGKVHLVWNVDSIGCFFVSAYLQ